MKKKCVNCSTFKRKIMFNINNLVSENFDELVAGLRGPPGPPGVGKPGAQGSPGRVGAQGAQTNM